MTTYQIGQPYPIFNDKKGDPLDGGYIYIGESGKDPSAYPIQVYWDENLTLPALQPLRTINGYIVRNGSPYKVFCEENFSILILDKYESVVAYSLVGFSLIKPVTTTDLGFVRKATDQEIFDGDPIASDAFLDPEQFKRFNGFIDTLADLQVADTYVNQFVFVKGRNSPNDRYQGFFTWDNGDFSIQVAADPNYFNYVPKSGDDGTNGAWLRMSIGFGNSQELRRTSLGINALKISTGSAETAIGEEALGNASWGAGNVAIGYQAHYNNTSGYDNVAIGDRPLFNNTTGSLNVGIGFAALEENTTGYDNIAIGADALKFCTTGNRQTGIGINSCTNSVTGTHNTGVGYNSLRGNTVGNWNIAIGSNAHHGSIGARAEGLITFSGLPNLGETFEVHTQVFTWATLRAGAGQVMLGATINECIDNAIFAINTDTSDIGAFSFSSSTITVFANAIGTSGNSIVFQNLTSTNMSFSGTKTLSGGTDQPTNDCDGNITLGFQASYNKEAGDNCFVLGTNALYNIPDGSNIFAVGTRSMFSALSGTFDSVGIGSNTLENITDDSPYTVAVGSQAGRYYTGLNAMTNAKHCVFLGFRSQGSQATALRQIVIGSNASGMGDNTITIGEGNNVSALMYGTNLEEQGSPAAKTTTVTLTATELLTRIIIASHSAGAPQVYTLPINTDITAALPMASDTSFTWYIINLGSGINSVVVTANTNHTVVGNMIVDAGSQAQFITRKNSVGDYITYRVA
jgi:hypothetical protein